MKPCRRWWYGLAVLADFGLIMLLLGSRSETIRGLTVARDERFAQLDLRATALSGLVMLLAAGGLAYLVSFVFFRWRG